MTALPETGREIPADPMAKIRREVDRVNEQSADQYDEWMAERGVTTSRAEWKRRALAAEARLASLEAERAKTVEETSYAARFNRLNTLAHRILWVDLGLPAMNNLQTQQALTELSQYLLSDALDEALARTLASEKGQADA